MAQNQSDYFSVPFKVRTTIILSQIQPQVTPSPIGIQPVDVVQENFRKIKFVHCENYKKIPKEICYEIQNFQHSGQLHNELTLDYLNKFK